MYGLSGGGYPSWSSQRGQYPSWSSQRGQYPSWSIQGRGPLLCSLLGGPLPRSLLGGPLPYSLPGGVHFHVHFWGAHVTYPIMLLYTVIECPGALWAKFTWDPSPHKELDRLTDRQTLVKTLPFFTTWRAVINQGFHFDKTQ